MVNELAVSGNSSSTSRANDLLLGTKVKASFVDAKDVFAVEEEIAGLIARQLSLKLDASSAAATASVNPQAHRLPQPRVLPSSCRLRRRRQRARQAQREGIERRLGQHIREGAAGAGLAGHRRHIHDGPARAHAPRRRVDQFCVWRHSRRLISREWSRSAEKEPRASSASWCS